MSVAPIKSRWKTKYSRKDWRYWALFGRNLLIAMSIGFIVTISGLAWKEDDAIIHPVRTPITHFPTIPYETMAVQTDDHVSIKGWFIPATTVITMTKAPVILLLHGVGGNRNDFNEICETIYISPDACDPASGYVPFINVLHNNGYAVLTIDQRAHGESGGDFCSYGINETKDVSASLDYLKTRQDVDMGRIGVFGQSLGSMTAIRSAARLPLIRAVAVESPFADLDNSMGVIFNRFTRLPSWGAWPLAELSLVRTGVDIKTQRPILDMPALGTRPFYVIGDKQDNLALFEDARKLYDASNSPDKEIWEVDTGHVQARYYDPKEFYRRLLNFFAKSLTK